MLRYRPLLLTIMVVLVSTGLACISDPPPSSAATTKQSAVLLMHPQIAQPGTGVASAAQAKSAMSAVFTPARSGRKVVLQRRNGTGWVSVASSVQDARGRAQFTAPYAISGLTQVYRAYTVRTSTLPMKASGGVTTSLWGPADFTDEFTGATLSDSWSHRGQEHAPESKRRCSKGDPRAVAVAGGAARLSVMPDPDRGGDLCDRGDGNKFQWRLNGHIGTSGSKSFLYGYAAARIRFQPGHGQHGSFWLQAESRTAAEGSAIQTGAEIDVIEWFGDEARYDGLCNFVYDFPDDGKADSVTARKTGGCIEHPERYGADWASKYHVFSVEWTPNRYVFRIDGKETFRTSTGVSGQPEYLILSLLSSDYELSRLGTYKLPQHMYVDWVRYWER